MKEAQTHFTEDADFEGMLSVDESESRLIDFEEIDLNHLSPPWNDSPQDREGLIHPDLWAKATQSMGLKGGKRDFLGNSIRAAHHMHRVLWSHLPNSTAYGFTASNF